MSSSVAEQIAALEQERTRLERRLSADEGWRALQSMQALNGSAPPDAAEIEQRLRRALAGNPYYSARLKIVEAITILRRLGEPVATPAPASAANGHERVAHAPAGVPVSAPDNAQFARRLGVPLLGSEPMPKRDVQLFRTPGGSESAPAAPAVAPAETAQTSVVPAASGPLCRFSQPAPEECRCVA